jgi:hypothetical protein
VKPGEDGSGMLDRSRLYPLLVPRGYLPSEEHVRVGLLEGLDITFVEDLRGLVRGLKRSDLDASKLSLDALQSCALDNLVASVKSQEVHAAVFDAIPDQKFVLWGGSWLAATCLLLPRLLEITAGALGTTDLCAAIPHRDAMLVFPVGDATSRAKMQKLIDEKESDGRKPITRRLVRLSDPKDARYYEAPSAFSWLD